ncbi:MAG: aspartate/glutamate racemase family protein, partial [Verrucomicrobiota bacterium]
NQGPRDPGTTDEEVRDVENMLQGMASPGTQIVHMFTDDFPGAKVHEIIGKAHRLNGVTHHIEALAIIQKITWAAENGYDAVIQSNTFDPGVEGGRLAVRIPVIGLLRSSLAVASTIADKFAILGPLDSDLPTIWRTCCAYQMQHRVVGMRGIGIYSDGLKKRKDEIFERVVAIVKELVRDKGAECIIPLGGKLIPYAVDPKELEKATGAPILNTKAIGIQFAEMSVRFGIAHSPLAYPPSPARHEHFMQKLNG